MMPESSLLRPMLLRSRMGCKSCKQRKVKCNEVRPVCGNCAKRYIGIQSCEYDNLVPIRQKLNHPSDRRPTQRFLQSHETKLSSLVSVTPYPPGSGDGATRRMEGRLMHHYTTVVCYDMPTCNGEHAIWMWQQRIPMVSFHHDVVLDAVLAVAALHLHAQLPHDAEMASAVTRYLDKSVTRHRIALPEINPQSAEALLLAAIMISTSTWVLSHRPLPNEAYELPMLAYNMVKGVGALFHIEHSLFKSAGYGWFGSELPAQVDEDYMGSALVVSVREDLKQLAERFEVESLDASERVAYEKGMKFVSWLYRAYVSDVRPQHLRRFIGAMPVRIGSGFMELLSCHDPLAMALLARGTVLLRLVDHAWWSHGGGQYQVAEYDVHGICKLMPAKHAWVMRWPLKVLSGEIGRDV